jgi:hypothetical protein
MWCGLQARRAAALHAAEAIAAQAAGEQEDEGQPEGPQGQAEPALWPQPSFDAARLSPHIMKGRRTVRRRNEELLAGAVMWDPHRQPLKLPVAVLQLQMHSSACLLAAFLQRR